MGGINQGLYYNDVIMSMMASQITSLTIVYSTVYSGADQRKPQSSASVAFVRGNFTGHRWIPCTNGQLCGKCFHLMTSSCTKHMVKSEQNKCYFADGIIKSIFCIENVCIITVTSLWTRWRLKSPVSPLFTQLFVQAQIKKTLKLPVT